MQIGWPQGIVLVLVMLGAGKAWALAGELKKPDRYDIVDGLIGPGIWLGLLWWGGFFS